MYAVDYLYVSTITEGSRLDAKHDPVNVNLSQRDQWIGDFSGEVKVRSDFTPRLRLSDAIDPKSHQAFVANLFPERNSISLRIADDRLCQSPHTVQSSSSIDLDLFEGIESAWFCVTLIVETA